MSVGICPPRFEPHIQHKQIFFIFLFFIFYFCKSKAVNYKNTSNTN